MENWDSFIKNNTDNKGNFIDACNLTPAEMLGRQEIQRGVKDKGWMLYCTDKSGKLCLDTRENFINSMRPHFENEQEVQYSAVLDSEKVSNNYTKSWVRILGLGLNAGHNMQKRIGDA